MCLNRRGFVIGIGTLGSLFADDGAVLKCAKKALVMYLDEASWQMPQSAGVVAVTAAIHGS